MSGKGAAATLLLFDIDGTLVSGATEAHREAMHAAIAEVHGVDAGAVLEPPSPAGRTDGEIARLILRAAGVAEAEIDAGAAAVREACCRIYAQADLSDLPDTVLPGVPELLAAASGRSDVIVALLTGNFEPVARRKLAAAGIGSFFAPGQGAFGTDSEQRAELPPVARERAGRLGARNGEVGPHPRERTIVIGDTPRDIACARADGVRCVGLATGQFSLADLREADLALPGAPALHGQLGALVG